MMQYSRPSKTDVVFVAMDVFVEKVYEEDLSDNKNVTAKSYPLCV